MQPRNAAMGADGDDGDDGDGLALMETDCIDWDRRGLTGTD